MKNWLALYIGFMVLGMFLEIIAVSILHDARLGDIFVGLTIGWITGLGIGGQMK